MKKIIYLVIAFTIFICFSFKKNYDLENSTAKVAEENGLLIFSKSEPLKLYRVIGEVKVGKFDSDNYGSVSFFLSKDAKKQYPTSEGIIIDYEGGFLKKGYYAKVIEFNK